MHQLAKSVRWGVWQGSKPHRINLTIGTIDYALDHKEAITLANKLCDAVEAAT